MQKISLWCWLPAIICLALGIVIQHLIYLHLDVAWLVAESQKFLAGGQYGKDFFDPNPPLILYLYFPIVWLTKYTFLNTIQAVRGYTFLVGIISILISMPYINNIFKPAENLKKVLFIATIAFCYFILPTYQFAQREHFILMLTTPYILSVIAVAENKNVQSCWLRIFVGILAGIGFSIKPYYLLTPMITEIYLLIRGKQLKSCFRIENMMLMIIVLFYVLSIYWVAPNYYTFVLPFVAHFYADYESEIATPMALLSSYPGIAGLMSVFFALIIGWRYQVSNKIWILIIVTVCYFLFFIISARPWFYHAIPMFAFSLLLLSVILGIVLTTPMKSLSWLMLCIVMITFILVYTIAQIYTDFREAFYIRSSPNYIATHIIDILKRNRSLKSLYVFDLHPDAGVIPALYSGINNCSRFTGFWMMPDINKQLQQKNLTAVQRQRLQLAVNYMRNSVIEDFQRCQPDLVIVDAEKNKPYFFGLSFDYIKFFSADKRFQSIWKNYCYQKIINNNYALYLRCHS